jgi:hypothetical protein
VSVWVAEASTGKTTLFYNLLYHLAEGHEFLGFRYERPLRVLWLDAETPEQQRRLMLDYIGRSSNLAFYEVQGSLQDSAERRALVRAAMDFKADIIAGDSLSDLWPVEDENSNSEANKQFLAFRDEIARVANVHLALTHHSGKGEQTASGKGRGASARRDRCDIQVNIDALSGKGIKLEIAKSRYGTNGTTMSLAFAGTLGYERLDYTTPGLLMARRNQKRGREEAAILGLGPVTIKKKDIVSHVTDTFPHIGEREVERLLTRLSESEAIKRPKQGWYDIPAPDSANPYTPALCGNAETPRVA